MKSYFQFLLEQKETIIRKYYIFDWDDNLLKMPTKIYLHDKSKDELVTISTEDFVEYRNDDNYSYVSDSFIEFKDSGTRGNSAFLEDVLEALRDKKFAPSWPDFLECLRNGSLFAIVTARGHNPKTLKEGVRYIIEHELNKDDYQEMVSNLLKFKRFYDDEKLSPTQENELIDEYLNKCGFYPINNEEIYQQFNLNPLQKQEELKLECIKDFIKKVKRIALIDRTDHWNYQADIKVDIGFSDDDYKNAATVARYGGQDLKDLKVYHTSKHKQKMV